MSLLYIVSARDCGLWGLCHFSRLPVQLCGQPSLTLTLTPTSTGSHQSPPHYPPSPPSPPTDAMSSLGPSASFRSQRYSDYGRSSLTGSGLDQYLNTARNLFEDEVERSALRHFARDEPFGYTGPVVRRSPSQGNIRTVGDRYEVSADVSQFEPEEVVVTMCNYHVTIRAEKVVDDGTVSNVFTHKYQLPEDVDPMTLSCCLSDAGMLTVSVKRDPLKTPSPQPVYRSEIKL
uniref:Heat shock protein beta-7-like protein n=1 Tax=Callorhinchus milii TaxID=7868 RepID=V9L8N7_CALMI